MGGVASCKGSASSSAHVPIQAVIFDLDGTLIDYEGVSHDALNQIVAPHGKEVDWQLHSRIVGRKMHDVASIILDALELGPLLSADAFVERYYETMEHLYAGIKPMRGLYTLLDALQAKGIPMAIGTSSYLDSYKKKMKYHQRLTTYIQLTVCGDDPEVKNGKPAPDIYAVARKRLEAKLGTQLDPGKCLVFEDSPHGLKAAVAAGMLCVSLPDSRIDHKVAGTDFSQARWVCKALAEFDPADIVRCPDVPPRAEERKIDDDAGPGPAGKPPVIPDMRKKKFTSLFDVVDPSKRPSHRDSAHRESNVDSTTDL